MKGILMFVAFVISIDVAPSAALQKADIRVRVEQVVLYVRITDKNGDFIFGLKPTDFIVEENGVVQNIATFAEVSQLGTNLNKQAASGVSASRMASNHHHVLDTRELVIFHFDQMPPTALVNAKEAVKEVLKNGTEGGFYALGCNTFFSGFHSSKAAMVELIDKLNYNDLSVISVPVDTEGLISSEVLERGLSDLLQGRELRQLTETKLPQQSQWVLTPLRIFESYGRLLKYIPGRKTLVYFSPGQGNPEAFGRDAGDVPWRLYDPVYQARFLNDANITLLAINPLGLQATVHSSLPIDPAYEAGAVKTKQGRRALVRKAQAGSSGTALANEFLKTIAQETGGEAVTSSNDISGSLRKLFGRNESYYLLSYTSSNELPDGRFRRVQVRTNFPKLTVAHRSGYLASMSVPGLSTTERLLLTWIIAAQKRSDFQISTEVSPITTEGATSYLPFKVAVPMKQLPMKKEINEQGKEMYSCKVLIAGALRQLSRQWLYKSISFELDSTTYQRYIGENFIYSDRLQLDKFGNDELIVIVASPDLTKVGSTSTNLDAKSP